jgi:hypothetical protein
MSRRCLLVTVDGDPVKTLIPHDFDATDITTFTEAVHAAVRTMTTTRGDTP